MNKLTYNKVFEFMCFIVGVRRSDRRSDPLLHRRRREHLGHHRSPPAFVPFAVYCRRRRHCARHRSNLPGEGEQRHASGPRGGGARSGRTTAQRHSAAEFGANLRSAGSRQPREASLKTFATFAVLYFEGIVELALTRAQRDDPNDLALVAYKVKTKHEMVVSLSGNVPKVL